MVAQSPSLSSHYNDPLRNFKFQVQFTQMGGGGAPIPVMGFMTVQGLTTTIQPIPYAPGGLNAVTQKLPATADFGPITLTTGVACTSNPLDLQMFSNVFSFIQGGSPNSALAGNGSFANTSTDFRYTVDIQVLGHPVTTVDAPAGAWFHVYDAWPTTFSWADLDAGSDQVFIKEIVLVNGGFDVQYASTATASVGPS
jgi:phage tail-like protein